MAKSREVCCCNVYLWTTAIAWLEMGSSVIAIIILIMRSTSLMEDGQGSNSPGLVGVLAVGFVMSLVNLIMGIILLKGANERNARYVKAWLIYLIISVIVNIIIKLVIMNMEVIVPEELIGMLIGLVIVMFVFWVVWELKKEIEMDNMGGTEAAYNRLQQPLV